MELKSKVLEAFASRFHAKGEIVVSTPGRVNLIGEHTDYNGGFVFPFAIDKHILMVARLSPGPTSILAADFKGGEAVDEFEMDTLPPPRPRHWSNYVAGVIAEFQLRGMQIPNLQICFAGNIPSGGGLSSSAALANCVSVLVNEVTGANLPRPDLARISQMAEHHYAGVRCGIMDQFVTLMGKKGHGMKLDCRSLEYESVPLTISPYRFILCNSNVKHELADSEYNTRRAECENALAKLQTQFPSIKDLRDCTAKQLEETKEKLTPVEFKRVRHQVEENRRVQDSQRALKTQNLPALGHLMLESHASLDQDYEVTCPELNSLVEIASQQKGVLGARMTGGGFGGNTINLVHEDFLETFTQVIRKEYHARHALECDVLECIPSAGTTIERII